MSEADRFGIARLLLWSHVGAMVLMLLPGHDGLLRLLPEQLAFAIGLATMQGANAPERVLLVLHLAGLIALAATLVFWDRGDDRVHLLLPIAAATQFLLAPIGIAPAVLLIWLRRHPEFRDQFASATVLSGERRNRSILTWLVAWVVTCFAGLPAFLFLGGNWAAWLGGAVLAAVPQLLVLRFLMARRLDDVTALPPLPELVAR